MNAVNANESQLLDMIRKALSVDSATGTSIAPYIKEDLEDEAYLQLYSEPDPHQMSLLKDLPRQQAQQVNHEFVLVDRYGNHSAKSSFAANALPPQANIEGVRKVVNLKLYGKTSAVQGLTVLQNTIRALGQPDIAASNDLAVRLLLQYQINSELFILGILWTETSLKGFSKPLMNQRNLLLRPHHFQTVIFSWIYEASLYVLRVSEVQRLGLRSEMVF